MTHRDRKITADRSPRKCDASRLSRGASGRLPPHLSVLIGSLDGPGDLGRNHDKYLTLGAIDEGDCGAPG